MDTLQIIERFKPCHTYNIYVHEGILTEGMSLQDIIDSEDIPTDDVNWLLECILETKDRVYNVFVWISRMNHTQVVSIGQDAPDNEKYIRTPIKDCIPFIHEIWDELTEIEEE